MHTLSFRACGASAAADAVPPGQGMNPANISHCLHIQYLKGFALCRRPPRTRDALIGPWGFLDKELILETAWIEPLMFFCGPCWRPTFRHENHSQRPPEASREGPGGSQEAPGTDPGAKMAPGGVPKPSWRPLGRLLGRLGGVLEPSWSPLGPSWGRLGPSWGRLGPS